MRKKSPPAPTIEVMTSTKTGTPCGVTKSMPPPITPLPSNDNACSVPSPIRSKIVRCPLQIATVGLSTGFTHAGLEDPAKVILALTMFVGRIGSVTLAAALAASQTTQLFTRPEERPIVG